MKTQVQVVKSLACSQHSEFELLRNQGALHLFLLSMEGTGVDGHQDSPLNWAYRFAALNDTQHVLLCVK